MSRYVDITTISPKTYESSDVELGVLAYDYDEVQAMPFLDIVWCKDCKHNESSWCPMRMFPSNLDFCSYGEREGE